MSNYNLSHLFKDIVTKYSNKKSICFGNDCLTFNEIDSKSSQVANYFFALELDCGDVAAISSEKCFSTYIVVLACLKAGVAYSFFDDSMPSYRLEKQFEILNPKYIFTNDASKLEHIKDLSLIGVDQIVSGSIKNNLKTSFNSDKVSGTKTAYIMFTSGSTGEPKGVAISHANVINFVHWVRDDVEISNSDRVTGLNKLFFDNSVFDFYGTFFTGACLFPIKDEIVNNSYVLFEYIKKYNINIWFSVPSLIIYHLTIAFEQCKSFNKMSKIIFGGEGFPKNNLKKLSTTTKAKLVNVYGPTECTCICSSYDVVKEDLKGENMNKLAPIGSVCRNTDYLVIDQSGIECDIGKTGELYIGGVSVGSGYWGNMDLTNQKFIQNPLHTNYIDIYYKSGDLVFINKGGLLEFVSRSDYQIKHMGYRIELSEIDNTLQDNKDIYESCAVYMKKEGGAHGIIKLFYSGSLVKGQVLEYLIQKLPSYMLPKVITCLELLPKNRSGKIDRNKLLEM